MTKDRHGTGAKCPRDLYDIASPNFPSNTSQDRVDGTLCVEQDKNCHSLFLLGAARVPKGPGREEIWLTT